MQKGDRNTFVSATVSSQVCKTAYDNNASSMPKSFAAWTAMLNAISPSSGEGYPVFSTHAAATLRVSPHPAFTWPFRAASFPIARGACANISGGLRNTDEINSVHASPQGLGQGTRESLHHLSCRFDESVVGCHLAPGIFTSLKREL